MRNRFIGLREAEWVANVAKKKVAAGDTVQEQSGSRGHNKQLWLFKTNFCGFRRFLIYGNTSYVCCFIYTMFQV